MPGHRAIAAPHHLATEAGEQMYRLGGSAVDAALSAAAVLTVVYPHNTSIGGDLVALVSEDSGEPELVTAFGWAPAAAEPGAWGSSGRAPHRGPKTITVPGALKGWKHLHERYGRLDWATILAPAITHAQGYPLSSSVRNAISDTIAEVSEAASLMEKLIGPDWETATSASNPALGRTLARIAEVGLDDFYTGAIAEAVLGYLRTVRPDFAATDFAEYEVRLEKPLSAGFAGHRVHTSGAPSQGFALLRLLDDLREELGGEDLTRMSDEVLARIWLDSFTISDDLRDSILAEGTTPAALLDRNAKPRETVPAPTASGDTIGIAASDERISVSLIQSLYSWFGSLCFDESTGILFQSRGSMFSLDPTSPQVLRPRARPAHTLMPVLVTDAANAPLLVQSTMGGKAQAQIHARLVVNLLRGKSPSEAVDLPRWVSGPKQPGDPDRTITVESDVPQVLVDALAVGAEAGPRRVPPFSDDMGHANIIDLRGPVPLAASDPRSNGSAWVG
ncbi:gamma-glutamyltransferase [Brevibacterium sp.]|uniref:gamma-glutamyltransferase n=1 Tax=Brevibacterium sp. TaxID=1701 RepID=UPI0028115755|nr:gamma-glutamyltransferase [Brevibacterium sp.]